MAGLLISLGFLGLGLYYLSQEMFKAPAVMLALDYIIIVCAVLGAIDSIRAMMIRRKMRTKDKE